MNSPTTDLTSKQRSTGQSPNEDHWIARHSRPVIFLILTLGLLGAYLAFTIPVSVFPSTDFPRVLIGVDNGVMPIDQMTVTVTRPIEEAVNSVPGLLTVRSTTSRGSAEVDLYFRLGRGHVPDAAIRERRNFTRAAGASATAKVDAHRLTFAAFPIMGYSFTSDSMPQTKLWEMATYEMKPRLNRLEGVSTVIVQGGQEPEFHITPDPAKLLTAGVTVSDILDAVRRTNLIDSPGLLERNHQLFLGLVNGQVQTPEEIANAVIKNTPAGIPVRIGDVSTVAPGSSLFTRSSRQTANRRSCSTSIANPTATPCRSRMKSMTKSSGCAKRCRPAFKSSLSTTSRSSWASPSAACATPSCSG